MNSPLLPTYGVAVLSCALGIAVALVRPRNAASTLGWFGAVAALATFAAGVEMLVLPPARALLWTIPNLGPLVFGTTPLGGFFTCAAALVYVPTSIYSAGYLRRYASEYSLLAFALWYYVLLISVMALFVCRDVASFFIVWEIMALSSAALVAFEWRKRENARAAYLMLAMSEAGTLAALIAVLLALSGSGSLVFGSGAGTALGTAQGWAVFLLSFFGFGVKAGLLPVNSWLPRAHPVAPGNVSALLSAVILNAGVYGILLVNLELAPVQNPAFGVVALVVGVVSALVGILYATIEDDLKTMLAYSSVENIGIAVAAIGAGFVFLAYHHVALAAIGLSAGLYHLLNHSTYKGLLFLATSTVHAQTGLRSIDRLGGLIRVLPVTAFCFLIGALSISSIPPLNGFVSEWLALQTLLRSADISSLWLRIIFALSGAALALTAALAVTCFVKAFGMTFLGLPRTRLSVTIAEAPKSMRNAPYVLVVACVLLGIFPTFVLAAIDLALAPALGGQFVQHTLVPAFFAPAQGDQALPPAFVAEFHALGAQLGINLVPSRGLVVMLRGGATNPVVFAMSTTYLSLTLLVLFGATYLAIRALARATHVRRALIWAGGLRSLEPEMTYTGTGFSNPVRVIFDAVFRPATQDERETVHEHFRTAIRRGHEDEFLPDRFIVSPLATLAQRSARTLARMHHGHLEAYVLYALTTLLALFLIAFLT